MQLSSPLLYEDTDDVFEREPYSVLVTSLPTGTGSVYPILSPHSDIPPFFLLGLHAAPKDVVAEMNLMDDAFAEAAEFYGTGSGIILGDLNADCRYLSLARSRELDVVRLGEEFTWLIGRHADTTTRESTHCAYDR